MSTSEFSTAVGGALLIGHRDETRLTQKVTLADGRDNQNVTTFQPTGNASRYAYLLISGTIATMGFVDEDPDVVKAQLASVMASRKYKPVVLFGKEGLAPGTEANFARCLISTKGAERSLTGVTSADAAFGTDGSGILDGVSLHPVFGDSTPGLSEKQKLVFTNADPNVFRGLRAQGTTQVFPFTLNTTNVQLGAGIAALPAYAGRVVTVTGDALTGQTLKSGTKQIAFDGSVDVPQLEVVSGLVESLAVANGVGNYTLNSGAQFQLGITEGALQTNQRNLGGAPAGVVVKGTSVANSGPGQIDSISGTGPTLSVNHAGKTAVPVDFTKGTSEMVRADLETRYRGSDTARAGAVIAGAFTKATAGSDVTNVGVGAAFGQIQPGENPATLFDNILDSPALPNNSYAGWDFGAGQTRTIEKLRLYPTSVGASYPTSAFRLEASGTGAFTGEQTLVFERTTGGNLANNQWAEFTFAPVTARAFRYVNKSGATSQVSELEFIGSGTPASADFTIAHDPAKENLGNVAVTGAGYVGNTAVPRPNGNANFKSYYPLNGVPAVASATGLNANANRLPADSTITASTTQKATGIDANFSYNVITTSDAGEWIDYDEATQNSFHLVASVIHAPTDGQTLTLIVETADADGAGNPLPASVATLHQFEPTTTVGSHLIFGKSPVKRLIRLRYAVTGQGEWIFAVAIATR